MPSQDEAVLNSYRTAMSEVRARLGYIKKCTDGEFGLPGQLVHELCFLQLRMICELIALACIAANGEIANSKLRQEWSAENIMKALSEVHPRFYPQPIMPTPGKPPVKYHFVPLNKDYLTKPELMSLVAKSGGFLHRGSFKNVFSRPPRPSRNTYPEIIKTTEKIANLVSMHRVTLVKPGKLYLCEFVPDPDQTVRVHSVASIGSS